jgi:prefoldin alpha subunit
MAVDEKAQTKVILYQMLQTEFEELKRQAALIEARMMELETTNHALAEIEGMKSEKETLVPLGSGCYTHGRLSGSGIILDIGAGIMVKRDMKSARGFIDDRRNEIESAAKKVNLQMNELVRNINELTPEIEKIIEEAQKSGK